MAEINSARQRLAAHEWWHTIEVVPGVFTPGSWDLRPTADRLPWPPSLEGTRGLDVGTMDGFWAFELERRGVSNVVAIDLLDPAQQDSPSLPRRSPSYDGPRARSRGDTFRTAADLLGSRARLLDRSIYDLDPADVGTFDVIVVGYVLQMLRDPLRALEAVRSVCRGHVVVVDTVSAPLSLLPAPLARLNARRGHLEWFVFNRAGIVQALSMTGFSVEAISPILRDQAGPAMSTTRPTPIRRLQHTLGLLGRSIAVRARAQQS